MKAWVQVLLTVVIVAAGIFVYDTARTPTGNGDGAGEAREIDRPGDEAAEAPPPRPEAEAPSLGAVLEGTGDELWRAGVDARIAELEALLAAASGSETGDPAEATEGAEDILGPASAVVASEEEAREIQRQRLKRFRAMLEAVERQRRVEKAAWKVKQFLDTLDLALSDEQQRGVVSVTLDYQSRWARANRSPANTEEEKEERRASYRALWAEYGRALEDVVPRSEADKILIGIENASAQGRRADGK